jgi:hypothetical protein
MIQNIYQKQLFAVLRDFLRSVIHFIKKSTILIFIYTSYFSELIQKLSLTYEYTNII